MISIAILMAILHFFGAAWMENPAVVGLIVAIPSGILGYLGYRRSRHVDAVAEQAGVQSSQSTSIGQVVDGLNALVGNLQEDNRALRDHVKELNTKLDLIISECQGLKQQIALLSA